MIQDLMIKGKDEFLEHFARLGVFSKVSTLAGPQEITHEQEIEVSSNNTQPQPPPPPRRRAPPMP